MKSLSRNLTRFYCLLAIFVLQFACTDVLLAAREPEKVEEPGGFGLQYAFVVLAVGLAISVVCRPGKRDKEAQMM